MLCEIIWQQDVAVSGNQVSEQLRNKIKLSIFCLITYYFDSSAYSISLFNHIVNFRIIQIYLGDISTDIVKVTCWIADEPVLVSFHTFFMQYIKTYVTYYMKIHLLNNVVHY